MDSKGYWHNNPEEEKRLAERITEAMGRHDNSRTEAPLRFVVEMELGSTVEVTRGDDRLLAVFEKAEKNKVTLCPLDEAGKVRPYLELAETVTLSKGDGGEGVKAQVWDNRNGKIILRTLPVH